MNNYQSQQEIIRLLKNQLVSTQIKAVSTLIIGISSVIIIPLITSNYTNRDKIINGFGFISGVITLSYSLFLSNRLRVLQGKNKMIEELEKQLFIEEQISVYQSFRVPAYQQQSHFIEPQSIETVTIDNYNQKEIYTPEIEPELRDEDDFDLIESIADYDGHLMISSRTGSGKTTLLLSAIKLISDNSEWYVIDPKHSKWLGLEQQNKVFYPLIDKSETIGEIIELLNDLTTKLRQRQQQRNQCLVDGNYYNPKPIRIIIDEWLALVAIADNASYKKDLINLIQNLFYTGREDKIFVWICGQTHACKENGFSTGVRDNLGIIALGRNGNYASIEKALNDFYLIPNKGTREDLSLRFKQLTNKNQGIYYTNINNHYLGITPILDSDTIKRDSLIYVDHEKEIKKK